MPKTLPLLTRAESELMELFWRHGPLTVHDLATQLPRAPAYNTVLTLVRILEKKGYLTHSGNPEGGRAHLFRPVPDAGQVKKRHVRDLVDRLFGGRAEGLVVGLVEDEALSRADLQRLRAFIDQKLGKRRPT